MSVALMLWKYRWFIITGILLIVIMILSGVVYSKNKNIKGLNQDIGKLTTQLQAETARSHLLDNKLDSCLYNSETPEERDERGNRLIEVIKKQITAENIGKGFTPELERCIRERENCLQNLKTLMAEGKCPDVNIDAEKAIYEDAIQIMNHIDKEINQ